MAEATNKLCRAGSDDFKKLHGNILISCVGECKIPLQCKEQVQLFPKSECAIEMFNFCRSLMN